MKFSILIICLVALLSNGFYIFYNSHSTEKPQNREIIYTYKTPDDVIWINKDKEALQRMRNHYIEESDSVINRLEAEKRKIIPHNLLGSEVRKKLSSYYNLEKPIQDKAHTADSNSLKYLIINSLIIISGFSIFYFVSLLRRSKDVDTAQVSEEDKHGKAPESTIPKPEEKFEDIYGENMESVKGSIELNNSKVLEKIKEIVCEALLLISDYSDNCIVAKSNDFEDFTNRQISKIKGSLNVNDFNDIEGEIKERIPSHLETVRSLIKIKFDEIRALINDLARDFESVTKDNTNFSGHIKNSMTHIEKAIEAEEIKEIRKKITYETSRLRKTITRKQEKDAEVIKVLSCKVKTMNDELTSAKKETMIDGLTQIYNRRSFDRKLSDIFENGLAKSKPFTLIMGDVDHFKKVNDDYGHVVGDEVLKRVAKTIKSTFRLNDFVARYGGEEFVIMIDSIDRQFVRDICERFRKDIETINFKVDENLVPISISAGVAYYKESDTTETIIERADKAMYLAKRSGRNIIKSEEQLEPA